MERREIISKKEEKLLEQKLDLLFSLRAVGEDYSEEYEYVRQKTEELMYTIPATLLLITEDQCSTIFLSLYQNIDRIIFSYRISANTGYIDYLKGVLRLRAKLITKQEKNREGIEEMHAYMEYNINKDICYAPAADYIIESFEDSPLQRQEFYSIDAPPTQCFYTSLKECFQTIVNHVPRERRFNDMKLQRLYRLLSGPTERRDFVILLLTTKSELDPGTLDHLATILDVDVEVMLALELFRHESQDGCRVCREGAQEVRNHHWVRYIALSNALEGERDPAKKEELRILRDKCLKRLHKKCENIGHMKRRLSVRELSPLLGLSPSTISKAIRDTKERLARIVTF